MQDAGGTERRSAMTKEHEARQAMAAKKMMASLKKVSVKKREAVNRDLLRVHD